MNALERLGNAYPTQICFAREDLAVAEGQLVAYRERLGVPFQHEGYLKELTRLRDQLKAGLAGGQEGGVPSELAEKIKQLRAANTVEAAPQRTAKKVSAEEPVTTRIRRREEPGTVVDDADVTTRAAGAEEERKAGRA